MSFCDYRDYSLTELETIFDLQIIPNGDLFVDFSSNDNDYTNLQNRVGKMEARISISKDAGNEATRRSLLISHVLWKAVETYDLGIFFEPHVDISKDETPELPHQLNGKYDCAINLNLIDFIAPILSVVEVKPTQIAFGLGQCIAEMYATLKKFNQNRVYGIITDGEVWKFLLMEDTKVTVDRRGYHVSRVAEIVDRVGYIARTF